MKIKNLLILPLATVVLVACGHNNSTGGSSGNASSSNGTQTTPPPNTATPGPWQNVTNAVNSTVTGGPYNGFPLINVDPATQTIQLRIPMLPLSLGSSSPLLTTPLPGLKGVSLSPITMPDGTLGWELTVPLSLLLKNAACEPLATLPNGDPLPHFPSEKADRFTLTLSQFKYSVTVYIALNAVAVFVEMPDVSIPSTTNYDLVNCDQTRNIGYMALIPPDWCHPGGVYLEAQIPTDVASELNNLGSF
jgi:hypothetical protein